jgi:hypothetical protein
MVKWRFLGGSNSLIHSVNISCDRTVNKTTPLCLHGACTLRVISIAVDGSQGERNIGSELPSRAAHLEGTLGGQSASPLLPQSPWLIRHELLPFYPI